MSSISEIMENSHCNLTFDLYVLNMWSYVISIASERLQIVLQPIIFSG